MTQGNLVQETRLSNVCEVKKKASIYLKKIVRSF